MRALSRLAAVAAILLVAVLAMTSVAAAHPGHGNAGAMAIDGYDHVHAGAADGTPAAFVSADDSAAFLAKGCAGACCTVACSMTCAGSALGPAATPGALPDLATTRYAIGHAAIFPDAPARRHPKPPRA
jgi:hypothetical protein